MIALKRLNGAELMINAELIEALEPRPGETVVCLATGNKYVVAESAEHICEKIVEYRRKINAGAKVVNPIKGYVRESP